jgi:hypothetical protein
MSCRVAEPDNTILAKVRFTAPDFFRSALRDSGGESADEGGSWYVMTGVVSLLSGLPVALR